MALSSHELYLILRARDEASRILQGFSRNMSQIDDQTKRAAQQQFQRGQALATLGVGVAGAGLIGMAVINDMTEAAAEYAQQVALTATQLDDVNISMGELSEMGKNVARDVPLAFDQMQLGLYDIFSSLEVNKKDAETILEGISKAAVGGQTDIQTAGRATIAILNAYKRPAEDVTAINDTMFQLVRKGVGTYEEFTTNIGKSIPSAVKAGQSFESLSGMMAFMTRNGMSVAMSSTSAARALDAMANPNTIKRFEEMGVTITDANGQFRPMADVMTDVRGKLSGLSEEARAAKLQEIFKGSGGTIQAMRFFNLAVADGSGLLQTLTGDMHNAGGAADEAYNIMANTPQAKLQLLSNRYAIMKTTIGEQLLPAKIELMEVISNLLDRFSNLSPEVVKNIAYFLAFGSAILTIVGGVLAVVGVFLMFSAAATMAGTTLAAVLTPIGLIIAGLIALGVGIYMIIKYWDEIKAAAQTTWNAIWQAIKPAVDYMMVDVVAAAQEVWSKLTVLWNGLWPIIVEAANKIWTGIQDMVNKIRPHVDQFIQMWQSGAIQEALMHIWNAFAWLIEKIWGILFPAFMLVGTLLAGVIKGIGAAVGTLFSFLGDVIGGVMDFFGGLIGMIVNLINGDWAAAWQSAQDMVKGAFDAIVSLIIGLGATIVQLVWGVITGIIDFFVYLWDELVGHSIIPDMINGIIDWFSKLPAAVLIWLAKLVLGAITWFVNMRNTVVAHVLNLVGDVVRFFSQLPGKALAAVASLVSSIAAWAISVWDRARSAFATGIERVLTEARSLPGKVVSALSGLASSLYSVGIDMMNGLVRGISNMGGAVADAARNVASTAWEGAKDFLGIGSPSKLFMYGGEMAGEGLIEGMLHKLREVANAGESLASAAATPVVSWGTSSDPYNAVTRPPDDPAYAGAGGRAQQNFYITTQEIDPRVHAAELGWELDKRVV